MEEQEHQRHTLSRDLEGAEVAQEDQAFLVVEVAAAEELIRQEAVEAAEEVVERLQMAAVEEVHSEDQQNEWLVGAAVEGEARCLLVVVEAHCLWSGVEVLAWMMVVEEGVLMAVLNGARSVSLGGAAGEQLRQVEWHAHDLVGLEGNYLEVVVEEPDRVLALVEALVLFVLQKEAGHQISIQYLMAPHFVLSGVVVEVVGLD